MPGSVPNDLAGLVEAVRARFWANRLLSSWEAAAQVLDEVSGAQLVAIYRKARASQGWCDEALRGSDEDLITAGIENICLMLRRTTTFREDDDRRSRTSLGRRRSSRAGAPRGPRPRPRRR